MVWSPLHLLLVLTVFVDLVKKYVLIYELNQPSLIMLPGCAVSTVAAVLPGPGVGRRRPGGMRRMIGMRMWHPIRRPRPRRAQPAAVPPRPRPLAIPIPIPLLIPVSVSLAIPLPVSIPVPLSISLPLRPASLSVHQIVRLQWALFPTLPILMFVFTSAGVEKRYGRELSRFATWYKLVEACERMEWIGLVKVSEIMILLQAQTNVTYRSCRLFSEGSGSHSPSSSFLFTPDV